MRSAGVDAEAVVHSYDVDLDEQMNARGYWEEVAHPIVGPKRFPAWPMRFASRTAPWFRRPAPLLGQHNDEVLGSLGITEEELAVLAEEGIIGTRPAGRLRRRWPNPAPSTGYSRPPAPSAVVSTSTGPSTSTWCSNASTSPSRHPPVVTSRVGDGS